MVKLPSLDYLVSIFYLLYEKTYDFFKLNFNEVRFENINLAYAVGTLLIVVLSARVMVLIILRSKKYFIRKYSGGAGYQRHAIPWI